MAVTPAFELAIPAPYAASFTDAEKAISVATPIGATAARAVRHLSKWFDFEGGLYTFKALGVSAAAWMVSTTKGNGLFFHRSVPTDGVISKQIYLPRGRHRIDIVAANIETSAGPCYVAFNLRQDGKLIYASAGAGWVFDSTPINDTDIPALPDYRLSLAVFAVQPNWKDQVTERLNFVSETFADEGDGEQRRSLRRYPTRSFEASFLRSGLHAQRIDTFFSGIGRREFLLPLWHDQHRVSGTLTTTVSFPTGTLVLREFAAGSLVLAIGKDPRSFEVLTIQSVNLGADTITFSAAPTFSLSGCRLVPLRVARMLEQPQVNKITDGVGSIRARFTLVDSEKWPTPQWDDPPVFGFSPNWAEGISMTYDYPSASMIETKTGTSEVFDLYNTRRVTSQIRLQIRGRQAMYAFRQFIGKARGRAVRFWHLSQTADLKPLVIPGGFNFDVQDAGLVDYVRTATHIRKTIAIVMRNGSPTVYREISNVTKISGGERIELATTLPAINLSDIRRIMFVYPVRFDQDSFELNHLVDASQVVTTSVVLRSNDPEDMSEIT